MPRHRGGKTMRRAFAQTAAISSALLGLLPAMTVGASARADEPGLSISGYDPVAYFTDGRPVQGKPDYEYLWRKLRWRFASGEHRDIFSKDPKRYAPQYDGYCAMGVTNDAAAHKDAVDPNAWAIVDGKLYLVHNTFWLEQWRQHARDYIKRADLDWHAVEDLPAPTIVGPPCAASPPTTLVALRDGGHWLVVGGQVARDDAGNTVGKGNMRAQIDQVGKNVDACLKAGGASVNDIVFTVTRSTALTEFDKYTDLAERYFGPPSPKSLTVPTEQLPSPDYLLQVEAFAAIK